MFILYAVLVGLAVGLILGGRLGALGDIRFGWAPLILVGFVAQVVLFTPVVSDRVGAAGPPLYVLSTLMVGVAVLRNFSLPGMPWIAGGAISNLAAILANGGYMPASAGALASLGHPVPTTYSNSTVVAHPALEILTDQFALPTWLPFANVYSVGDVLLAIGVAILVVRTMRGRPGPVGVVRPQPAA